MIKTRIGGRAAARFCAVAIAVGAVVATAAVAYAGNAGAASSAAGARPVVGVVNGAVRGKVVSGVNDFLGIPYAAPPVGPLRWKAPQPAANWSGVRDATTFGPNCAQSGATPFGIGSTSENCLYLNVYAPAVGQPRNANRPVMVWIHGGGLALGESQDYDPTALAAAGTVVVTINYRLGALGFLAHPALADSSGASGDYGWMDQQAALRWVQRNIGQFGGDAHNVTIAGQSAGGLSVLAQVASPGARGLFSRAIVESGDFALTQTPLATAEKAGEALAANAGCPDQSAACLRALPASALVDAGGISAIPGVVDGNVLKQSIGSALASGQFNRVPIINGSNHDEEQLFVAIGASVNGGKLGFLPDPTVTSANYQTEIASALSVTPTTAAVIAAHYPVGAYSSPAVAFSALDTDSNFACTALKADQMTSKYVPTFAYEFNDENAPARFIAPTDQPNGTSFPNGAVHIAETQYLFGLPTAPIAATLNPQQQKLATSMKQYWADFAAWGVPFAAGQPAWSSFNNHSQQMLSLVPPRPQVETNFAASHQCGFWAQLG
jgi:para-nitrobenzyl esterase